MNSASRRAALAAASFACFATGLVAQSFAYPDFSSTAQLSLLGSAMQSGTALRLTANLSTQNGCAWRQGAVPVVGGFETTFTFRVSPNLGSRAEGMALVIHDDPNGVATQGGPVWGLGYGDSYTGPVGIRNSIAIEFDTYYDSQLSDSSANEVSIHTRGALSNHAGEQFSIARATPAQSLADYLVHTMRVRYVPGTIEVFVDGATTPLLSRAYDFVTGGLYANGAAAPGTNMANGTAIVGFTATTMIDPWMQQVEILSWTWNSTPLPPPCYAGSLPQDVLRIDGSTGDTQRQVQLATYQSFGIGIDVTPAAGPGMPYVLFASLAPQPGAPGTALGFGDMCFPVLPTGASELVLVDGFGLFPAVLPAPLAPTTIVIPPAIVTLPLQVTMQAVTIASVNPFALGVSNAVDLVFAPSPAPSITAVAPISAQAGSMVTISGQRFLPGCTLLVGGATVTPALRTATQIVFACPAGTPCGSTVAVVNPDGQAAQTPFNPTPVVTGTQLGTGPAAGNAVFVVQGTGFSAGSAVTIGGAPATVLAVSPTILTIRTPPGAPGVAPVVITTAGGCVANTTYTYQ